MVVLEGPEIYCQVGEIRRSFHCDPRLEVKRQSFIENEFPKFDPALRGMGIKIIHMPDQIRCDVV